MKGLTGRRWILDGVGVTAWDSHDAESLVLAWLGVDERPEWLGQPERCRSVPEHLIEPIGPLLVRGIWYPVGNPRTGVDLSPIAGCVTFANLPPDSSCAVLAAHRSA